MLVNLKIQDLVTDEFNLKDNLQLTYYEKKALVQMIRKKWKHTKGYCSMFEKIGVYKDGSRQRIRSAHNRNPSYSSNHIQRNTVLENAKQELLGNSPGSVKANEDVALSNSTINLMKSGHKIKNYNGFHMDGYSKIIHNPYKNTKEDAKRIENAEQSEPKTKVNIDLYHSQENCRFRNNMIKSTFPEFDSDWAIQSERGSVFF